MKKKCVFLIVALGILLSGFHANAADPPAGYAAPLVHTREKRETEYVIALDNSYSMRNVVKERNEAAKALIDSLPFENTSATVFLFDRAPIEPVQTMLEMGKVENRKILHDIVDAHKEITKQLGTDLGKMMEKAQNLLRKSGKLPDIDYKIFIVTDGTSDVSNADQAFFDLCGELHNNVEVYVVYIPGEPYGDHDPLTELPEGLHTELITLREGESGEDMVRSRLTVWRVEKTPGESERGKVMSIQNPSQLKAALMNLRFSDADDIFNCNVGAGNNSTVSFYLPSLCVQELTVALIGSNSQVPAETVISQFNDPNERDLLELGSSSMLPSIFTVQDKQGLPEGRYTMQLNTSEPMSIVVSWKYGYQFQFCLADESGAIPSRGDAQAGAAIQIPAETKLNVQMELLTPDGTPLDASESTILSMNIYRCTRDDTQILEAAVQNGGTLSLQDTNEAFRFYPVVSYGGISEESVSYWEVESAKFPLDIAAEPITKWMLSTKSTLALGTLEAIVKEPGNRGLHFGISSVTPEVKLELSAQNGDLFLSAPDGWIFRPVQTYKLFVVAEDGAGQQDTDEWEVTVWEVAPLAIVSLVGIVLLWCVIHYVAKYCRKAEEKAAAQRRWVTEERTRQQEEDDRRQKEIDDANRRYKMETELTRIPLQASLRWRIIVSGNTNQQKEYLGGLGLIDENGAHRTACDLGKVKAYCLPDLEKERASQKRSTDRDINPFPRGICGIWKQSKLQGYPELIIQKKSNITVTVPSDEKFLIRHIDCECAGQGILLCFGVDEDHRNRTIQLTVDEQEQKTEAIFELEYF